MVARTIALAIIVSTFFSSVHAAEPADVNAAFEEQILAATKSYESYARADDEVHWAPFLCRAPKSSQARLSASTDETTHGQKLFFVFAKDRAAYIAMTKPGPLTGDKPAPPKPATVAVGQIVVKESWIPEKVDPKSTQDPVVTGTRAKGSLRVDRDSYLPFAKDKEGHLHRCKEKADLYVILKLDPKTPGTDEGWVYGTVTSDGKKVTSAGRVQSCMECHVKAPHERLFGIEYSGI